MPLLTPDQTAALAAELAADPAAMGYAAHRPHAPGVLLQMLDQPTAALAPAAEHMLTDRGLIDAIVPAHGLALCDSILDKLEQQAAGSRTVARLVARLYSDPQGIDWASPALRQMLVQWRGTVLTADEADALLALPMRPASRRQLLGLPALDESDVARALAAPPAA